MSALNYHHLRYFHRVAHEGHLTRAAEQLHLSQSALSAQIRQLEDRLGVALFIRQGRRLVLTEAGEMALTHANAIFSAGDELLATLEHGQAASGIIRIGAVATLSRNFQMTFLEPLFSRTDTQVELRSGTLGALMRDLLELRLDVVLSNELPFAEHAPGLCVHTLNEQPIGLIGTPALTPPAKDLGRLLAETPLILPTGDGALRAGLEALFARLAITPRIAAEVDDMAMTRLLVRAGLGLAPIPPVVVRDELDTGVLHEAARLPNLFERFHALTVHRQYPHPLLTPLGLR